MTSKAQSYNKLWKKVEKAQQSDLPQTVITCTEDIYRKAETEKNSGQMLKAYTVRSSYRQLIDPDSFYVDLKRVEQWAATTAIQEDCAVLHTLIARIYSDYARQNQWSLRRSTDIADVPAEDMREWSSNMFVQKVLDHTHAALEDAALLSGLSSKAYIPFVAQQPTSRYFNHNMYHLLSSYGIHSLQSVSMLDGDSTAIKTIGEIYSNLDAMYRRQNNKDALVLLALDGLNWRREQGEIPSEVYQERLDDLINVYGDREIVAEVYLAKVRHLIKQNKTVEAWQLCQDAILKFPKYERVNALKELQNEILRPLLSVNMDAQVYPGDTLLLNVSHANLDGFTVHFYQVNLPATSPALHKTIDENFYKRYTRKVRTEHFALVRSADYLDEDAVFELVAPPEGIYVVEIVPDSKNTKNISQLLSVTPIKLLSRSLPDKQFEFVTLDAKSGQPIGEATVHLLNYDMVLVQSVKTNAEGRAGILSDNQYKYITAGKDTASFMLPRRLYSGYYGFLEKEKTGNAELKLLTDRSIYRPGQTVYVKGIAYSQLSDTANVMAGKQYTLTLFDANYRKISHKELTTNEFGSFTAEFVLPSGGLNGNYTISSNVGRDVSIRVEEYKRPTFEVTIDSQEGTYRLNDTVSVKGSVKTYSGMPIQELPVQYVVTRSLYGWWGRFYDTETTISSGTASLNDDGVFTLPVVLTSGNKFDSERGFYIFTLSVTVTDVAGETQTSTTTFRAGERSLLLSANVSERINKDEEIKVTFSATNLDNKPVDVEGTYRLYRFIDYQANTLEQEPAHTGTFTANSETRLSEWESLPTGVYKLMLTAKDERGREANYETQTILFSVTDNRPVENLGIWYHPLNLHFDAAHPGEFIFGTSDTNAYILMDVFSGNKRIESRSIHLSDSIMRFTYPYKPEYEDGLSITFCYVKDGRAYTQDVGLHKRLPEKELELCWSVFRDKLRPGQQEEWKLTIKKPDGAFADAELLATMYDASLDKIWKRPQYLWVNYPRNLPTTVWSEYYINANYYGFWFDLQALKYPALTYDSFWMDQPNLTLADGLMLRGSAFSEFDSEIVVPASRSGGLMVSESAVASNQRPVAAPKMEIQEDMAESLSAPTENLRTNFAETAFFYPQLRTNENGEVSIAFTMPESLTRWKFSGYAHTKGMLTGMINSEVVTSKEFMLTPNMPRFVRVGDRTSVAASVANLTGKAVSGNVVLTLFDPLTEKVIATQKQKFTAEAGKTAGVNFMFTATEKYNLLGCRLVAEGGNFSDGEQHLLPVLSNKERVIETVAMPVRGNQTREFLLDKLFNNNSKTATNRSLTVEFSGNPAWYAVQALPSLSLPPDDNAVSWATAYYANTLASYIMNSQPRLKTVFEAWKKQGGTKETFLSNLQKNQDVKNILLEESPWLMEATTEQEQKERIATLFDLNNIRNNNSTALNKLKELQLSDGAWTWYKGMPGNRYITTYVMQSLIRLKALIGESLDPEATAMYDRAFEYLHQEASEEYTHIRKAEQEGAKVQGISSVALQYLYFIALSGESVPKANKAAYDYFLAEMKKTIGTQSITEKAIAAVVLQKAGRAADAAAFMASLKEYTTQTDEHGMFFAFNENPYSWAELKVPAHVTVMEAFDLAGNNSDDVEEMKLWLLKEKQTRQWNSPVATANAVYALLYRGTDMTANRGDVRITLGNKTIETLSSTSAGIPGIAYIKETITDKGILAKAGKVVVEKRDAGVAWGAVYAGYEEELDKVGSHGEGLNIDKKLYVERITGNKKELLPVASGTQLKTGDKVVSRITIKLDRAMDFVQLKDQRAACFEPVGNLSGYMWGAGTGYYVAVKDASTNFYFDALNKGVYVLEHSYRVNRTGTYESGLATIQSAYAPEYASHAPSVKLKIEN